MKPTNHLLPIALLLSLCSMQNALSQGVIPTKGKEFWLGFMQNSVEEVASKRLDLFITSDRSTTGTVSVPAQGWNQNFSVSAFQTTTVNIPNAIAEHIGTEFVDNKGVHVVTQDTVSVFAINFEKYSSDGSKIYPKASLDTAYRITTYEGLDGGSWGLYPAEFLVVATEDNTQVRITPTTATLGGRPANVPFIINLNAGQSYHVKASTYNGDFTGTTVIGTAQSGSCRLFAVFSGSYCTRVPPNCTACDHIFDQAIPLSAWGTTYYAVPFSFASSYTLRILAHQNNTVYTVNGGTPTTLNAGQFNELSHVTTASCIQGNKPFSAIQFMEGVTCTGGGDPAMLYLNAEDQKIDNVTFSTVTSTIITQHNVNVIIETANINQLTLDGAVVLPSLFTAFPSCPSHSYAKLPLTQGSHTLNADSGFTAYVYGTGSAESYAYSVGSFSKVKPIQIDSILCTSDTVRIGSTTSLYSPWWSTATNPNDTIYVGPVLTITPPIIPDLYILHGNEYLSGCEKLLYFNVEIPDPPVAWVSQSADTVCQYQPVQLHAGTIPASSVYQYHWTPATGLNNPNISNPIATPSESTWYVVAISTPSGCGGIVYDSLYIYVTNGNISKFDVIADDTLICTGESAHLNMIIEKTIFEDDFDPAINNSLWNSITGTSNNLCGSLSGNALYFNGNGTREAVTNNLNVSTGGTIYFSIKIANGTAPCDDAEFGENVVLEYSNNGGPWNIIATYYEYMYPNFTPFSIPIPPAAQTANTRFRWRQVAHSGINQDNWVLDDVRIGTINSSGLIFNWSPSAGLSATNIQNPTATPLVSTTYVGTAIDNVTGCVYKDSIYINVGQNFTLNTIPDTNLCVITGIPLYSIPSWGSGHTYHWTPESSLSDSSSATPTATPSVTTTYHVTVTSRQGCVQTDSVRINVVALSSFDAIPDEASICAGDTVPADVFKSGSCGTYGSACSTTDTAMVAYNTYTSSSTGTTPYSGSYLSARRQYLFKASELTALGMNQGATISKIAFQVYSVSGTGSYQNFTIKMGCTSLDVMSSIFVTGLSTVFNPKPVTVTAGLNYYVFDNTYNWDGTSNLIVEVCYENTSYSSNSTIYYHTTGFTSAIYNYGSSGICNIASGYTYTYRPNIVFKYCPTPATDLIYSWSPTIGVSDPTIRNPLLFPSVSTTYTVTATDSLTGCIFSDDVIINVGNPFSITVSDDTILCSVSGVPLTVSHTAGPGATYSWSPDSLVSNPFAASTVATPTTNTTFHVAVTSADGCTISDSVTVTVVSLSLFNAVPDEASICAGDTVQADVFKSGSCGTYGSACSTTDTAMVAYTSYTSSSTGTTPYSGSYLSSRKQYLFQASELNALGMNQGSTLSQIAFQVYSVSGTGSYQNFTIKMGCTALDAMSGTFVTGLATVFNPKPVTVTAGLNYYNFDNTYDWDGTSNLIVEVCYENTSYSSNSTIYYHSTGFTSSLYNYGSSGTCNITYGYTYTYRPNIVFRYCPTPATNLIYSWSPTIGVSDPTIRNPLLFPTVSTTYTVTATDSLSGCVFSDDVIVNVGTPFSVTVSDDTILCSASGVPLSVSHTAGSGASYSWTPDSLVSDPYAASTVATPTINTTFHVAVTSADGCTISDSVKVTVVSLSLFNAVPDEASICAGDTVPADVFKSGSCGTYGAACSTTDTVMVAYTSYTSSSTGTTPYSGSYLSSRKQYLFKASELNALGMNQGSTISQIAFQVYSVSGTGSYQNFTIKMGCTSLDVMSSTYITGLFTVFNPKPITVSAGLNYYIFDNTYNWDGTSNLIVEICYENTSYSSNSTIYYHATGFTSSIYNYGSSGICNIASGYTYNYRPNVVFRYCPTPATNLIYSWSPTIGVSDPNIRNPLLFPTVSTTYTVTATDSLTGCIFSDDVIVNVGTPFSLTVTDDTVLCSINGVPLSVSHTAGGGAIVHWTPGDLVSDSTSTNPIAIPDSTTTFQVSVTTPDGCTISDDVKVTVVSRAAFDATPDVASVCSGDSVQADVFKSNNCGTFGSVCSTTDTALSNYTSYTSSSTGTTPYSGSYLSARRQYIIRASELAALGMNTGSTISHLALQVYSVYGNGSYQDFTIKIGCTSLNAFTTGTYVAGLTTVFNPKPIVITTGYNYYVFDNTYDWDGTSNLIIEVCYQNTSNSSNSTIYYHSPGFTSSIYYYGSSGICSYPSGYTSTYRPNFAFKYCPTPATNLIYSWTPITGISDPTIKNPFLFPNTSTTYFVTANDTATGCIYRDSVEVTVGILNMSVHAAPDTTVCSAIGIQLHATDNAPGPVSFDWQPANHLNNSAIATPTIIVDGSQQYIVTISDSTGCSTASDTIDVTVVDGVVVTVSTDTAICIGDSAQLFATGGIAYLWSPTTGLSDPYSPTPKASPPTSITYSVNVIDTFGCTGFGSVHIDINLPPTVTLGNDTFICQGNQVTFNAGSGFLSYTWNDNSTNSTLTATNADTYWVEVTNQCGLSRDSVDLLVYSPPIVTLGNDTILCAGQPITLDAGNPGATYSWSDFSLSQAISPTASGDYWVNVTDTHNCTASDTIEVTFISAPVVDIGNDTGLCVGDFLVLDAQNTGATFNWSTNEITQTITVSTSDTFSVSVNNGGACTTTDSIIVTFTPTPLVELGNDTSICEGSIILLDAGNPGASYIWSTGELTQTIQATTSDTYWVGVTNDGNCWGRDTINITFVQSPVVDLGNDTILCSTSSITLDAQNTGATYHWSTNAATRTITTSSAGSYWVAVTNTASCTSLDTIEISYFPGTVVNLGPDITTCAGNPVTLNAGNPGWNYLWSNNSVTQTISPTLSGNYWVRVSLNGICPTYDSVQVTFIDSPTVNLGNTRILCEGQSATLDAGNPGATYLWSTGEITRTILVDTAGDYWVVVTDVYNCSGSDLVSVSVNLPPVVSLGNDTVLCTGESLTLDAANPGATYSWSNNAVTRTISVNTTNHYSVLVTHANGCSSNDGIQVTFKPLPQITITNSSTICLGDSILLNANSPDGEVFEWTPITALNDPNASSTWAHPITATTYQVKVWDSIECNNTASVTINLNYPPIVTLGHDTSFCEGASTTFNAGAGFNSYQWQDLSVSQTFTASQAGIYWVNVSNQCGTSRDTVEVKQVYPLPVINLGTGGLVCKLPDYALDAGNPGSSYLWSTGDQIQKIIPQISGQYSVTVTSQFNCVNDARVSIEFINPPAAAIGPDTLLCDGETLKLDAKFESSSYLWQDGSTRNDYLVKEKGVYWVRVKNLCGESTDSLDVAYSDCECDFYVPNAFTPNGDGVNDVFKPERVCLILRYDMKIFNRWGELVFETNDVEKGWDGTYKGVDQNPAVFVYMINFYGRFGTFYKSDMRKGSVTLLR